MFAILDFILVGLGLLTPAIYVGTIFHVPSTSNASLISRHFVSAVPFTKSAAFVPSRFSSANSFDMSLTLDLWLSRLLDMSVTYGVSLTWAL